MIKKIKLNFTVITSASTRNVEAVTKSCEKIATFAPAPIPSLADGAARRPVTTSVRDKRGKMNNFHQEINNKLEDKV